MKVGNKLTILKIDKEENLKDDEIKSYKNFENLKMEADINSYYVEKIKGFISPLEAKIWNARRKVYNFEKKIQKTDKESFSVWYGEDYKSLKKTKTFLEQKLITNPEMFI